MSALAAMSEQDQFDASRMQEVANAVRGVDDLANIAQKRKRDSNESADGSRRATYKRVSPNSFNSSDAFTKTSALDESSDQSHMNQQGRDGVEALQDYSSLHQQPSETPNGSTEHANAPSTAQAALSTLYPSHTMTIPQPTELSFANQPGDGDRNQDSYMGGSQQEDSFMDNSPGGGHSSGRPSGGSKPAVGSEEWHKVRKDNHKEVERRRRETINEGINELAKIVPGCEKNKGSILQRAVSFITQLKENEAQNIEKWTLEKLLTEQAIAELSASNDKLKLECERAWREVETWKKTCQSAGLVPKAEGNPE